MARPRLEANRGGVSDSKICFAVFVGVALGVLVSLLQLGGESKQWLSQLRTTADAANLAREGQALGPRRGLEERLAELEEERDALAQKHDAAVRQRENLAAEAAVLRKKLQAALQEDATTIAAEGKDQQQEIENLKKQLEKARETYRQPTRVKKEERPVAGPPGSIKAERTFPTIVPDPSVNSELAKILEKVAVGKELIVAVSNNNIRPMLQTWFENVRRTGATNYLVVCLDDEIAEFCEENGVPYYRKTLEIPDSQKNAGSNHAISGLKFHILREFMMLGYSVFLSDVDIVFLQNPFKFLHRDCDIEGMTDGHDNITAYGYDDVSDDPKMGWSRYAHTMRIWVFNSGLFYIRPTAASIELLDRVADRLSKEKAWDQAVFNEELFRPSSPGYEGLHASKRVLDYLLFMNSKVLFTRVRYSWELENIKPVSVHVNYHPDKYDRMLAVERYYVKGEKGALDGFPNGSER